MPSRPEDAAVPGLSGTRALGVDFGEARIGLALSDELGVLAHPLATVDGRAAHPAKRVAAMAGENAVGVVVVGLPRNMDGSYGPAAEKVRAFADLLAPLVAPASVVLWDERLTTLAAARELREAGHSVRKQRGLIDRAAACQILQSWLDARAARG